MANFLKSLFSTPSTQFHPCPYCLTPQSFQNSRGLFFCSNQSCGKEIPRAYVTEIEIFKPISVHAVGFQGHGKSVYLSSLIDHVERMAYMWSNANCRILNDASLDYIRSHRRLISQGKLPDSTSPDFPLPVIMHLKSMSKWQDRCLIIYDTAGENFEHIAKASSNGRFIAHAQTSLFLVSLTNLRESPDKHISDLFDVYLAALDRLEATISGRNIVVVYTKADLLEKKLPDIIQDYLNSDDLWGAITDLKSLKLSDGDMRRHVDKMQQISDSLRDFTISSVEYGLNLIQSAEARQINLRFAITTALGMAPNSENRLTAPPHPRRALDPFLWILEL